MSTKITLERVCELADRLKDNGEKITITSIREANGDYGNPTLISKFLKEWRKNEECNFSVTVETPHLNEKIISTMVPIINKLIHEEVSEIITGKTDALTKEILEKEQSNVELTNYLEKSENKREDLEINLVEVKKENEHLIKTIDMLKADNEKTINLTKELNKKLEDLTIINKELEIRIEHHTIQLESHKEQIKTTNELSDTYKNKNTRLIEIVNKHIDDIAKLTDKNDALSETVNELEDIQNRTNEHLIKSEKDNNLLKIEITKMNQEKSNNQEEINKRNEEIVILKHNLKNMKIISKEYEENNSTLVKEYDLKTQELNTVELELTELKKDLIHKNDDITKLRSEIKTSDSLIKELRQIISQFNK